MAMYGTERAGALRKFISSFPASARIGEARTRIALDEAAAGEAALASDDVAAAAVHFQAAVDDSPQAMPDEVLDVLLKAPAQHFFRGATGQAFAISKGVERGSAGNAARLLKAATFYMSIENGADTKRLAQQAIALEPTSAAAYEVLGLAHRMEFDLEGSAAAYAKLLEIDPGSLQGRRGLAEMKRSLGKADEAVALYREILCRTPLIPLHNDLSYRSTMQENAPMRTASCCRTRGEAE